MRRIFATVAWMVTGSIFITQCGDPRSSKPWGGIAGLKEAWDFDNEPALMERSFVSELGYTAKFTSLPLEGQLPQVPWSDDYWPNDHGGISYRWNSERGGNKQRIAYRLLRGRELATADLTQLSPAEKYDLYMGELSFPLTEAERERTQVLKTIPGSRHFKRGFKIPYWEGLCHSWAPATLGYREPRSVRMPITRGPLKGEEMPFGASDVKALLTFFLHHTDAENATLGMRCNFDLKKLTRKLKRHEISEEEFLEEKKACDDTNAGAFHIVLANQIGRLQEGFIVDVTREEEVWNQPVYGFHSQVLAENAGASPGAAPGTVKEVVVETRMLYVVEVDPSWQRQEEDGRTEKVYTYRLELDEAGDIIGGAWLRDADDRPDFLWKQEIPEFSDYFTALAGIYRASVADLPPLAPAAPSGTRGAPSTVVRPSATASTDAAPEADAGPAADTAPAHEVGAETTAAPDAGTDSFAELGLF